MTVRLPAHGLLFTLLLSMAPPAASAPPTDELTAAPLALPRGEPTGLVFLFTTAAGRDDAIEAAARRLTDEGYAVSIVDSPGYLQAVERMSGSCLDVIPGLERASKRIQARFHRRTYFSPLVAGSAEGAAIAWAILSQAPDATIGGAAMDGLATAVPTSRPFCPGRSTSRSGTAFSYRPATGIDGFVRVVPRPGEEAAAEAFVAALAPGQGVVLPRSDDADLAERMAELTDLPARQGPRPLLDDLPVIEMPADGGSPLLVVMWSGDGGWRDLDKQIALWLQRRGVAVVGIDALRYFWSARTPAQLVSDQVRIIDRYTKAWKRDRVVLAGYSFGADILPLTVNRLPTPVADRVVQVSLIGLSTWADLEFHVTGWIADAPRPTSLPTAPELARLDRARVQCIYGEEETDSGCLLPQVAGAEVIRTRGGHHLDGDYEAVARVILAGALRRSG